MTLTPAAYKTQGTAQKECCMGMDSLNRGRETVINRKNPAEKSVYKTRNNTAKESGI